MITPVLVLDSHERWSPCAVETILEVGATVNGQPVDLAHLPAKGGKIDFPKDMKQPQVERVGYHRAVYAGGLWWHQFWTFWLYNPKKYVGFGEHEGDWEMVQLGCVDEAGDYPVLMTCSQHDGGEKREYWRVELTEDLPKVYVARDSHANYFGVHYDVTDQVDGAGDRMNIDWREFGTWAQWPGKWGNSENSPGQLTTRRVWQAPHAWHGQARG
jgi:hypothetical protein